jgi:uncharacterized protein YbjT (DUF2867 family)
MQKNKTLIIGASGTVGSELVKILRGEGHEVITATSKAPRDKASVRLNLATGEGIHEAFAGMDKAFLLSPPGFADHYQILSPLIQEAKRRGLKKVVLMTALGANADESSPFRRAEKELEASGLAYNIVRPNWFMQNFHTFWVHGIKAEGKIQLPAGTAKTSFIHSRDISAVVAKLLTSDRYDNQALELTGPEALTHAEAAKEISAATGQAVSYEDIAPAELKRGLVAAGLPVDYVDFLVLIFGFLKAGYNERRTNTVQEILGRAPLSFQQYAEENKKAWA